VLLKDTEASTIRIDLDKKTILKVGRGSSSPITVPSSTPSPKLSGEYSFVVQGGRNISASVFPASEYGKGRQIVIFAPFMDYSDRNFYSASLAALHNIFGKRRGLFQLDDARKEYDSVIGAKVIYWTISNPRSTILLFSNHRYRYRENRFNSGVG